MGPDRFRIGEPEHAGIRRADISPRVTPKGASNVEKILQRHTEQVLFGQMTPEQAATSFRTELQKEIDSA